MTEESLYWWVGLDDLCGPAKSVFLRIRNFIKAVGIQPCAESDLRENWKSAKCFPFVSHFASLFSPHFQPSCQAVIIFKAILRFCVPQRERSMIDEFRPRERKVTFDYWLQHGGLYDVGVCRLTSLDPRFLINKMRKPTFRDHCRN